MDLTGIDVVIFDKDGTLIDFHAMWGGWARELGIRLEAAARRPVAPDVFAAIGFDPTSGHVAAGGPLASATMAGIEEVVAAASWGMSARGPRAGDRAAGHLARAYEAARDAGYLWNEFGDVHLIL